MATVNPHFVRVILNPLTGLGDDDRVWPRFKDFDSNDEQAVRAIIREMIVPYVHALKPGGRDRVQVALRYYLTVPGMDFCRLFDANLPPFPPPDDARDFFVWAWEECFPNEPYYLPNAHEYTVKADISEPLKY